MGCMFSVVDSPVGFGVRRENASQREFFPDELVLQIHTFNVVRLGKQFHESEKNGWW
jgi:hypothetical protein